MGRSGQVLTNSLNLRAKIPKNKQNSRAAITDNTNQYFRSFLKGFNIPTYLGYENKQVHNKPTED